MEHVAFISDFISCERLKSWEGHLNATLQLLNLFAALGHLHYAKSAWLYLQNMRMPHHEHPDLYKLYCNEGSEIDHAFNGLPTGSIVLQLSKCLKFEAVWGVLN